MITFNIDLMDLEVPENWNELSDSALLSLSGFIRSGLSAQEIKTKMVLTCIGGRVIPIKHPHQANHPHEKKYIIERRRQRNIRITPSQLARMAEAFDFLYTVEEIENKNPTLMLDVRLTRAPFVFPRLETPSDNFLSLTYEQFMYLQAYQERVIAGDEEKVTDMLAILYHRPGEFNPEKISSDSCILYKYQDYIPVLNWYYIGCFRWLALKFPRVFSGGSGRGRIGNAYEEQMRIVDALSDGDVTKKPTIRASMLMDVLSTMEENIRRSEDMKNK